MIYDILSFIRYTSFLTLTCFIDGGDSAYSLSILFGKLYQTGPVCSNISISMENISVENEQVVSNGIIAIILH